MNESHLDVNKDWFFGNNRSKNLRVSPPKWYAPFFLTTDFEYAEEYSDYGVYKIDLKPEASTKVLDFNAPADVKKLKWPKVLVDKIREGRNDLNSLAYDMYILAYSTGDKLMYIEDNAEWNEAADYFKTKSRHIFAQIGVTGSAWGSERDHQFLLQMWKDIYDAGFDGFTHIEFNSKVLAVFTFHCIDKISVKPVKRQMLHESSQRLQFMHDVPEHEFKRIVSAAEKNNRYFSIEQFEKLYGQDYSWSLLFDGSRCVAAAALLKDFGPLNGMTYVNELQSLVSGNGYGKKMLLALQDFYDKLWLMADASVRSNVLLKFYRNPKFKFKEHVLPAEDSIYEVDTHVFAPEDKLSESRWHKFLNKYWGNDAADAISESASRLEFSTYGRQGSQARGLVEISG